MLYRSFSSLEAAHENELGRYRIVKGKQLDYSSQSKTGVLISQAFAKKNGLDVGDKFTVAFPNDAKKTIEQTVRGIYEYTEPAAAGQGSDASSPRTTATTSSTPRTTPSRWTACMRPTAKAG